MRVVRKPVTVRKLRRTMTCAAAAFANAPPKRPKNYPAAHASQSSVALLW